MKKYTAEEKAQLLANLDLEVSHRARQFEELLTDALENFRMHQEGLISRVPRLVRDITLREFAKYNGDIQACLKGVQKERLGGEAETIDKTTRKRKWVESQETEAKGADVSEAEPLKATKSMRMTASTPKKKSAPAINPSTAHRTRPPVTKTPGTVRTMQRIPPRAPSPNPHKHLTKPIPFPRAVSRPASPSKIPSTTSPSKPSRPINGRLPSTAHFDPHIPVSSSSSYPRWPRKDESMLSINGSPLANPLKLGLDLNGWLSKVVETRPKGDPSDGHHRTNSIVVRTHSTFSSGDTGGPSHQRTNSQTSVFGPPQGTQSTSHSRTNSASNLNGRPNHSFVPTRSGPSSSQSTTQSTEQRTSSPSPSPKLPSLSIPLTALVAVSTADGHLLEFDPFQTSPGEIDALDISDSAKQQTKEDMRKLVAQAMDRWKIS